MRNVLIVSSVLLLSACASGPDIPDWQMNAKSSMESSSAAYLTGDDRIAAQEFANARSAMASTGQIALVARVEAIRCAARVASLVLEECTGFEKLRQDAAAPERAYVDYLAGRVQAQDLALLPDQHRAVLAATPDKVAAVVTGMEDPLSRLVAAGVLLRMSRANPDVIKLAVDTASDQGWRRPLLAWLGVQAMRAEQAGDKVEAQRLRRRMDMVGESK